MPSMSFLPMSDAVMEAESGTTSGGRVVSTHWVSRVLSGELSSKNMLWVYSLSTPSGCKLNQQEIIYFQNSKFCSTFNYTPHLSMSRLSMQAYQAVRGPRLKIIEIA